MLWGWLWYGLKRGLLRQRGFSKEELALVFSSRMNQPFDLPKLLAGSHLESQNYAGWLDGPLGVIYALEAAREQRLAQRREDLRVPVPEVEDATVAVAVQPPPLGIEGARAVMAAAENEASRNNWAVVISIIDSGGNVLGPGFAKSLLQRPQQRSADHGIMFGPGAIGDVARGERAGCRQDRFEI